MQPTGVELGIRAYEAGHFLDAHEHFELAWRASGPPRSIELHALAQLAAAVFKHEAHGRAEAAQAIAARALAKLERVPRSGHGLDLVELRASLDAWVARGYSRPPALARAPSRG